MSHRNAPLSETGRLRLARCIVDDGWSLRRAATTFGSVYPEDSHERDTRAGGLTDEGAFMAGRVQPESVFPHTPAGTAVRSVAARFYTPALLNHCIRSYLWGAMYAGAHRIAFDDELLYISAMLHDIGLTEAFDSHRLPFEEAGGYLAWVFGTAAGWPADRSARLTEIIVAHMRADVAATADPESHILQVATGWDVAGRRPEEFPESARAEILARFPRRGFADEFAACFEDQASRKPESAAAASVASDGAGRIRANPLDG